MRQEEKRRIEKEIFRLTKCIDTISNSTRLAIMGLLYVDKELSFEELIEETELDEQKLGYHLNLLLEVGYVERKEGKYRNTKIAIKILKDMGFIREIKKIKREEIK